MENFYFDLFNFVEEVPGINKREVVEIVNETLDELRSNKDAKILPQVVLDYIEHSCEGNIVEMMELKEEVENTYDDIITVLENKLESYCEDYNLCHVCGIDFEYTYDSEESEYYGRKVSETTCEGYCPNGCIGLIHRNE